MGKINQTNNYTDFFYCAFRNILIFSIPLVIISAIILSLPHTFADNSNSDNVSFVIPSSCTLNATLNSDHAATVASGQYISDLGTTT